MKPRRPNVVSLRLVAMLALLSLLGGLLASCGDDNETSGSTTTSGAAATTAQTSGSTTTSGAAATTAQTSGSTTTSGAAATTAGPASLAESILDAARAEGSVVFYTTTTGDGPKRLEEAFEAAYPGIDVEVVGGQPAEVLARISSEQQAGQLGADVVAQHDGTLAKTFQSEGVWAPIDSPLVRDERWAPYVKDDYVNVRNVPLGMAYSPEGLDAAPTEWADLTSDQLNGRVGLPDYEAIDVIAVMLHTLVEELGEDFLQDLAASKPRFFPGTSAMQELVVAGDLLAFGGAGGAQLAAKAGGAPIDVIFPRPTVGSPTYAAVNVDAEHPKAAQLFIDFLMSEEGQTAFVNFDSSPAYDEGDVLVVDLTEYTREELDAMKEKLNTIFGR